MVKTTQHSTEEPAIMVAEFVTKLARYTDENKREELLELLKEIEKSDAIIQSVSDRQDGLLSSLIEKAKQLFNR